MKHQQICYTRRNDIVGFTTFNCSPEISEEALNYFRAVQSGNQGEKWPEGIVGTVVWQFVANEKTKSVYNTRVEYGQDTNGRQAICSHAFVFPLDEFIKDPQSVLCVEESNYSFDREGKETTIPETLTRISPMSLTECVESLGMTSESYTELVYCIYRFLGEKAKTPLHIICDNSYETVVKYMVCIYAALPLEFRKKITFQNYAIGRVHTTNKTIIFESELSDVNHMYIEPVSSENNVLTAAARRRIAKYDFVKVVPVNYASGKNFDGFFREIVDKLALFDSETTTDLDLYKIAYDLIITDKTDADAVMTPEELQERLYELLNAIDHPYIDKQIQLVLGNIIGYQFDLNDAIAEALGRKLAVTENGDLLKCGYEYNFGRISRMEISEAVKYLYEVFSDRTSEAFREIKHLLNEDEKGKEILSLLYTEYVASNIVADKDNILAFYDETKDLNDRSKVVLTIRDFVRVYMDSVVQSEIDPKVVLDTAEDILKEVLYDEPELSEQVLDYVKANYWKNFRFGNINIDPNYGYEYIALADNTKYEIVSKALNIFDCFINNDTDGLRALVNGFKPKELGIVPADFLVIVKKISDKCIEYRNTSGDSDTGIDRWVILSCLYAAIGKNPAAFLIENKISSICNNFEEAYHTSGFLNNENNLAVFKDWMDQYADAQLETSEVAVEILKVIKVNEKRIKNERRQAEKEMKRAAKEKAKEENPQSIFSKFIDRFKPKKDNDDDLGGN